MKTFKVEYIAGDRWSSIEVEAESELDARTELFNAGLTVGNATEVIKNKQ